MVRPRSSTIAALLVGGVLLVGGCTSDQGHDPSPALVRLADADNGRTLTVAVGDRVQVVLASTYWSFTPLPDRNVLRLDGPPRTAPQLGHCVPGGGCGTVSATFTAVTAGTVAVTATRASCGEALVCAPDQRNFLVVVEIHPPTA